MTWLESRLERFERDKVRDSDIKVNAPALFKAVWDEVFSIAQEANGKGFTMKANGNSERRALEYTAGPTYRPMAMRPEIITVCLSADRRAVDVTGLKDGPLCFQIALCADNIVCLHFEGNQKTPEECAQIIMDNFLFAER